MDNGIKLEGFEELFETLEFMEITQDDESKAMRKALNHIKKYTEPNAPKGESGKTQKSIKVRVRRKDFSTQGVVVVNNWYAMFQEYRNHKQEGRYVGWFERSINDSTKGALNILTKELLK